MNIWTQVDNNGKLLDRAFMFVCEKHLESELFTDQDVRENNDVDLKSTYLDVIDPESIDQDDLIGVEILCHMISRL